MFAAIWFVSSSVSGPGVEVVSQSESVGDSASERNFPARQENVRLRSVRQNDVGMSVCLPTLGLCGKEQRMCASSGVCCDGTNTTCLNREKGVALGIQSLEKCFPGNKDSVCSNGAACPSTGICDILTYVREPCVPGVACSDGSVCFSDGFCEKSIQDLVPCFPNVGKCPGNRTCPNSGICPVI